ncbi:synaptogyrin-3-like [Corticium candelabrum]|uniref:synaptogyrin-3-like n=1 Tax=Corticium candelabrum TaxID=121492 RepID=UPI002E33B422|nr:synaptogyrin-3-like [Corticium candelabrum]
MEPRNATILRSIMRLTGLIFAIIVLGLIAEKVYAHDSEGNITICYFNNKSSACDFGLACGGLSIIAAVIFTVTDCAARLQIYSESSIRKGYDIAGSVMAGVLAILWLSSFGYMTNEWLDYINDETNVGTSSNPGLKSAGNASLAFSFLSVPVWVVISVLDFRAFRSL